LASSPVREIFEALRNAIQEMDPCITEDFLKLYVAYKAETNFVDVIPQARRLLLVLNVSLADIEDPKGLCRDISRIGRWGNGDVEVGLSSLDELPYVMNLVRQSFEYQMGGVQDS
jgi:predicted transport protein